jgi:hypothetical protein
MKKQRHIEGMNGETRIDMRNTMDFFCMLKACALIRQLDPGQNVFILTNDREFLADLRRVHPDCSFELESSVMGFENVGDFVFKVSRTRPASENQ